MLSYNAGCYRLQSVVECEYLKQKVNQKNRLWYNKVITSNHTIFLKTILTRLHCFTTQSTIFYTQFNNTYILQTPCLHNNNSYCRHSFLLSTSYHWYLLTKHLRITS